MKQPNSKWRLFAIALIVCLIGGALIWAGDHKETILSKGLLAFGVLLCIGGMGILRYLLLAKKERPGTESAGTVD